MKNTLLFTYIRNKHPGTFANRKWEDLSYPKNLKMRDTIRVALLKMQPHYNQSSRENATPSIGTSPLASYKEVPSRVFYLSTPPPPPPAYTFCKLTLISLWCCMRVIRPIRNSRLLTSSFFWSSARARTLTRTSSVVTKWSFVRFR